MGKRHRAKNQKRARDAETANKKRELPRRNKSSVRTSRETKLRKAYRA